MSENLNQNSFSDYQFNLVKDAIKDKTAIPTMALKTENGVYDFGGATVIALSVGASSITVKNAKISSQLYISSGVHGCKFENILFNSQIQSVVFDADTIDTLFEKCIFEGVADDKGEYPQVSMNARITFVDTNGIISTNLVNGNVILSDCHFKNYKSIIHAKNEVNCIFNNCSSENVDYIIYEDGLWLLNNTNDIPLKANIVINNLHSTDLNCVFKAVKPLSDNEEESNKVKINTNANIVVNGVFDTIKESVVDFEDGIVNLECNITGTSDYKLFSEGSPLTRYCNIRKPGYNAYRVLPEAKTYEFTMTLQPKETRYPFDSMYINNIKGTANSNVRVFLRENSVENNTIQTVEEEINLSTEGVSINDTGTLVFKNTATTSQTLSFTVETNCMLF